MRKLTFLLSGIAVLILSAPALAEDLTLPYPEFRPATPAYASSINANFEALRSGVNSNNAGIVVNRDNIEANSSSIGMVKEILSSHGHYPADIVPQGTGSALDADFLDGADSTAFADSVHGHLPSDITSQGSGSGIDADMLDGIDSEGLATSDHNHDPAYTPIGHTHSSREITGKINADTLDMSDATDFANAAHSHTDYALEPHHHDKSYTSLNHTHEDYDRRISEQNGRIGKLEGYGDLSTVSRDVAAMQETIAQLKIKIADLEKKLKEVSP